MYNITHKGCGGQLGKYDSEFISPGDLIRAELFTLNNGAHPHAGGEIEIECPKCKTIVKKVRLLEREKE